MTRLLARHDRRICVRFPVGVQSFLFSWTFRWLWGPSDSYIMGTGLKRPEYKADH